MTNWMTAAGLALIAGGLATLIGFRNLLWAGGGDRRRRRPQRAIEPARRMALGATPHIPESRAGTREVRAQRREPHAETQAAHAAGRAAHAEIGDPHGDAPEMRAEAEPRRGRTARRRRSRAAAAVHTGAIGEGPVTTDVPTPVPAAQPGPARRFEARVPRDPADEIAHGNIEDAGAKMLAGSRGMPADADAADREIDAVAAPRRRRSGGLARLGLADEEPSGEVLAPFDAGAVEPEPDAGDRPDTQVDRRDTDPADDRGAENPIAGSRLAGYPTGHEGSTEDPIANNRRTRDRFADHPVGGDRSMQDPAEHNRFTRDQSADYPVGDDRPTQDPVARDRFADDPVADDRFADDRVGDDGIADHRTGGASIADGPVSDDPVGEIADREPDHHPGPIHAEDPRPDRRRGMRDGATQQAESTDAGDDERAPVPPVRRTERYGDRVDGWVRPHQEDDGDLSFSGEYWTPVPEISYAEAGYGWPVPVERLPEVPPYPPRSGFEVEPYAEESEPTAVVPQWPPAQPSGRIELPRSWAVRDRKAEPDGDGPGEPGPARRPVMVQRPSRSERRRAADATAALPAVEDDDAERATGAAPRHDRRPRPRPRPSLPERSTVYRSRHAADPG